MPQDDNGERDRAASKSLPAEPQSHNSRRSFFTIPAPVKRVFDKFPLITYLENGFPLRAPSVGTENLLWLFTSVEGAENGRPSFNPSCLKWQVGF